MKSKYTKIVMIAILSASLSLLSGCGDPEEKARALYNKALTLQRAGNTVESKKLYNKIVEKYPSTEVAVKVNEMLAGQEFIDETLSATHQEVRKLSIEEALMLYKLDNGRYPSTKQGLDALVFMPTTGDIPKNWRTEGYLDIQSDILDHVESYSCDDGSPKIIMK